MAGFSLRIGLLRAGRYSSTGMARWRAEPNSVHCSVTIPAGAVDAYWAVTRELVAQLASERAKPRITRDFTPQILRANAGQVVVARIYGPRPCAIRNSFGFAAETLTKSPRY